MGLVLTRRSGEEIVIGNLIRIQVCKAARGVAKLHIDAPEDISVNRGEIQTAKNAEALAAGVTVVPQIAVIPAGVTQ